MEFEGTGGAETMLDSADDANDAGRRTAAPNLAARPSKDARRTSSTLQSTGHVGVLRMMGNFDNLPLNFSSKDGRLRVLILPPFCPNREEIICSAAESAAESASLSLSPHRLLYAQLASKL